MIACPEMIIIGAAGRHVGKTEFCCTLIRRLAADHSVVGIKITPVDEPLGTPPYLVTEESASSSDKDTSRMVRAGADKVFWLRTSREHLADALPHLLQRIPEKTVMVCESTSAGAFIQPGIFLIIRAKGAEEVKPSFALLSHRADRIITFDGAGWDFHPGQVRYTDGHWHFEPAAAATKEGEA